MKICELLTYLSLYDVEDELIIKIHDTITDDFIDSTSDIIVVDDDAPTLLLNVEAPKFLSQIRWTMLMFRWLFSVEKYLQKQTIFGVSTFVNIFLGLSGYMSTYKNEINKNNYFYLFRFYIYN